MEALQWFVWFALMSVVMGWLASSRHVPRPASETGTLRHPQSVWILGAVVGGFFVLLAVLCVKYPGKDGGPKLAAFFLVFAVLGAAMVAEYRFTRFELVEGGLDYRTVTGKRGRLPWREVTRVTYSEAGKWFVLEAPGHVVRVSAMLMGLPAFARAALAEVSPAAIDPGCRGLLEATAAGSPPSVWG